ncbi:MAG: hypothetical protein J0H93_09665 [Chlamydiales bacterium]|nr:hypothetical protein [Chlamydiales bacterium]
MMNQTSKLKIFFWFLLAISSALSSTQGSCNTYTQQHIPCLFSRPLFDIKVGYFFFSNPKLRKVYDKGGLDIQLCASYPLWKLTSQWTLHAYGALEYFQRSGRSIHGHQKTSVWSVPMNVGLKPIYTISANMQYYFAIGPRYFYIHQHNHSSYVYKNRSRNGLGFFVNTGFHYFLCDQIVIDIFGEYSYAKIHFRGERSRVYTRTIQMGGFTFGGGIGYDF